MATNNIPGGNKQSYVGTQVALCSVDRTPVLSDVIGDLVTSPNYGASMSSIDATPVSDTSGYNTSLPSNRTWKPISVTVFTSGENFNRIYQQFFANNPTEESVYCKLVFVMPQRKKWQNMPVPVFTGFISDFQNGTIDMNSAQQFTFEFTPIGVPELFTGWANITGVAVEPVSLGAEGGDVTVTVTGTNLIDGIMVKGFVDGVAEAYSIGYTTGDDKSQSIKVKYPSNSGDEDKTYTVKVSLDGGNTYDTNTATVTVTKKVTE